jgi:hypothetical protein
MVLTPAGLMPESVAIRSGLMRAGRWPGAGHPMLDVDNMSYEVRLFIVLSLPLRSRL